MKGLAIVLVVLFSLNASSTVLTVTSTANAGAGSLRNQIAAASSGDSIDFNLTYPATIFLTSTISTGKDINIFGPGKALVTVAATTGATMLDAVGGFQLYVDSLRFSSITGVALGSTGNTQIRYCDFINGPALEHSGIGFLEVEYCDLNVSAGVSAVLLNDLTYSCNAAFESTCFNISGATSGLDLQGFLNCSVQNSTFSSSQVGITIGNNPPSARNIVLLNNTLYSSASNCIAGGGGSLVQSNLQLENNIFYSPAFSDLQLNTTFLNATSNGGNVCSDASGVGYLSGPSDLNSTNPLLNLALALNGGYTRNHMLLAGSPAINNATASAPIFDQRDYGRNGVADAGAVELCLAATTPVIATTSNPICANELLKMWVSTGTLNDASNWEWYADTCGINHQGSGDTLFLPAGTTSRTYFVRGAGGCPPASNCDSITITINPDTILTFLDTICQGDSSLLAGSWRKIAGVYDDSLSTSLGCDSIIRTTLTVNPTYLTQLTNTICQGDSAFYEGIWQTASGTYYDTLQTVASCDSVIETTLTVNPTFLTQLTSSICQGDSAFLQNLWQKTSGTYYDTLSTYLSCDSVVETVLTVNPTYLTPTSASICASDSILLQGAYRTTAGLYIDTITAAAGCDSIVHTTLTVNPEPTIQTALNICPLDSALLQGAWQTTAGTYYDTLTSGAGCDSIVETTLTLSDTVDPVVVCPSDFSSCEEVVTFTIPVGTDNCPNPITTQVDVTGLTSGSAFPVGVTTLQYQVVDGGGRMATCSFNVTVHPILVVDAGPDMTVPCKQATPIGSTVTGATSISWSPSTGLDDPSSASPSASIEETTTYIVTGSNAQCTKSDTVVLTVDLDVDLIINTMLTPNGDGKNDTWDVNKTALVDGCKVKVFNRWGSVVWRSTGYDNSWDGTNNGMKVPEGTYWYTIECDAAKYKGYITLVR